MQLTCLALLLALSLPTAFATNHTQCFTYFYKKDGCVHGTPGSKQCKTQSFQGSAAAFTPNNQKTKRSNTHALIRRYDTYQPVDHKSVSDNVCKGIVDADDNKPGACLWEGSNPKAHIELGGWVSSMKKSNCGKQLWIQNKRNTGLTVYAPLVAACTFNDVFDKPTEDNACFQIGLSTHTFNELNPTDEERKAGKINAVGWGFNSFPDKDIPAGTKSKNGPV